MHARAEASIWTKNLSFIVSGSPTTGIVAPSSDAVLRACAVFKDRCSTGAELADWLAAIFADVAPSMRIAREEIFGPVVSVIRCTSVEHAVEIGNSVDYGLSGSIYTQDINRAFSAMRDLYTGIVYVNAPTIGAEIHLPFGGTKGTGNGHREGGTQVLDVFSEWKSLYIDYSGGLQRAQIDNAE